MKTWRMWCWSLGLAGVAAVVWAYSSWAGDPTPVPGPKPATVQVEEGAAIALDSDELDPTTTFEVRFDSAVIARTNVGLKTADGPLVLDPPVRGEFQWLSRRSGVFAPSEVLRLGQRYRVTLRPGLRDMDGNPVAARIDRVFESPSFRVMHLRHTEWEESNAPSVPRIGLLFNADVDPAEVARFARFTNASDGVIPAVVERVLHNDRQFGSKDKSWRERFEMRASAHRADDDDADEREYDGDSEERADATNAAPVPHAVWVTPAQPLPVGDGWCLELRAGLPSTERPLALAETVGEEIGDVVPFEVDTVEAVSDSDGRRIVVDWNKTLHSNVTDATITRWLSVEPTPTNLAWHVSGSKAWADGAFTLTNEYAVVARAGVPAREAFTQEEGVTNVVQFKPLPPRLWLPMFDATLLASGRHEVRVRSRNVESVRVRAKRLHAHNIVHALRAYESYQKRYNEPDADEEPYREVDFIAMPGQTTYVERFDGCDRVDEVKDLGLNARRMCGGGTRGAMFVAAESLDGLNGSSERPLRGVQAVVQVTDLGVYWQRTRDGSVWLHTFSLETGKPMPGVLLEARRWENELIESATSDAQGMARMTNAAASVWLVASKEEDVHGMRFSWGDGYLATVSADGYLPVDFWSRSSADARFLVFTERGVYRPGETVNIKAVVRRSHADQTDLSTPANESCGFVVRDAKGREFFRTNMTLSAFGSASAQVVVPASAPLGNFYIRCEALGESGGSGFHVQEFQPDVFELKPGTPDAAPGTPLRFGLEARYLMGKPLYRAKLRWSLTGGDAGFAPDGWHRFLFCGAAVEDTRAYELGRSVDSVRGEGEIAKDGRFEIAPELAVNSKVPQPRGGRVLIEVTDLNQQTISTAVEYTKHASDFYLGVRRFDGLVRAGDTLAPGIVAVNADETPHTNPVPVTLTLYRVQWETVRREGAGGVVTMENRPVLKPAGSGATDTVPCEVFGQSRDLAAAPRQVAGLVPDQAGTYLLEARAVDAAGRPVVSWAGLEVEGADADGWAYERETDLDVHADRTTYRPGDKARLLVKAPFDGSALVTVERESVLRSFRVELRGRSAVVEVPVVAADAPNVFVHVTLLRGAKDSPRQGKMPVFRHGYCKLAVERPETRLDVAVSCAAPHYTPGAKVRAQARVTGSDGKPVPGAEVALFAVDEGVLALTGYTTPDPLEVFALEMPLSVQSGISLTSLQEEDLKHLDWSNKGYVIGGGGDDEGGGDTLRKNFLPCAFWSASLETGADGVVRAEFTAPDSLTRYRVMAVVVHRRQRYGSGEGSFEVRKPLMIEPSLPRFARITDRMTLRALVHNDTDAAADVAVALKLDDLARPDGASRTNVTVAARSVAVVEFPVTFVGTGAARWEWSARPVSGTGYMDRAQSTLNVVPVAPLRTEILLGRLASGETNLVREADPQLLEGQGEIEMRIANTRLSELDEAVNRLVVYPYGCVEQTLSRLIPCLAFRGRTHLFPKLQRTPEQIEAYIETGVNRVLGMQMPSGGLSYWPGGREPMLWASAYGGYALALAKRGGSFVPEYSFEQLAKYLRRSLQDSAKLEYNDELSDRCFALLALAMMGRPEPSYAEAFYARRDKLSAESRAVLALAILEAKGSAEWAAELLKLPKGLPGQDDLWFGCASRETAMRLMAAVRVDASAKLVDTLVAELLEHRKEGHWLTTQGNAWSLLALGDYAERVEGVPGTVAGSAGFAEALAGFVVNTEQPVHARTVPTRPSTPEAPLLLRHTTGGVLYTQVRLTSRAVVPKQPRQDRGFSVQRKYERLSDDNQPGELGEPRVGDRVLVTLEIETRVASHFVAVDDPLPANFEAVNPAFRSREASGGALARDWASDFSELREDRALFFCDYLPPGRYTVRYLARVRAAGTATAAQTKVEEMYHPEHFGMSESIEVRSLPWE
jgi:uncharacterized protein YfaS (alpha-2-macroglobulin family)